MFFRNLNFPYTKQSGVQLLHRMQLVHGNKFPRSFVTIRNSSEKIQKKISSASNVVSSNDRLTNILRPFKNYKGKECFRHALFGLQSTMIKNIRNWQKRIYKHLVKTPLKENARIYYYECAF